MLASFSALLQVNNDLKTIGALAGLLAVPGLAVLSLLYFGQAREVRRLREWAGRAPERAAELEARVSAEAQQRVQTQPAPRPATAASTPAGAQAAPAGNGVAQGKPAGPATAAAGAAVGPAAGTAAAARPRPAAPPVPPRPAPSRPTANVPPRPPVSRGAGRDGSEERSGRFGRNSLLAVGAAVLVLVIVAGAIVRVVGGGNDSSAPSTPNTVGEVSAGQTPAGAGATTSRGQRAQTSIAVLNGTTVTGLARGVANKLEEQGFTTVAVTDASNQAQSATKVEYGQGHRDEARDVARSLKVPSAQVVPISDVDGTTAGPNAEIVVLVGQNFAK